MGCSDIFSFQIEAQACHDKHLEQSLLDGTRQPTAEELEARGQQRLLP